MASGTDGNIISYDTSGNPVAVATGSSGHVLTSAGAGAVPSFQAPAGGGKVLQCVSTLKTDTTVVSFTGTYTDISGLSVAITPSATSSKILVMAHVNGCNDINSNNVYMRIVRGSTAIASGASPSSRIAGTFALQVPANNHLNTGSMTVLDSPSSTSELTYKIQGETGNAGGGGIHINRSQQDSDNESTMRAVSSITVMEIGA